MRGHTGQSQPVRKSSGICKIPFVSGTEPARCDPLAWSADGSEQSACTVASRNTRDRSDNCDGLELAAKIHQVDPSLPVLFVTGALPEGDARTVGIVEKELLVRKPFSPKQLIDLVEARIRRF